MVKHNLKHEFDRSESSKIIYDWVGTGGKSHPRQPWEDKLVEIYEKRNRNDISLKPEDGRTNQ